MNHRGFSLPEVLVSLSLLALLFSIAAPMFAALERIHQENRAYLEALQWMSQQVEEWRHGKVQEDGVYRVGNISIEQSVQVWQAGEAVKRGEFIYAWRYGEKEWRVKWVIDRCCVHDGEGVAGGK